MYNRAPQKQYDDDNRGGLFPRQKKTNKSPDMGGDLIIGGDLLDYILKKAERGEEVKIELSAWRKPMKNGAAFLSLQAATPYAERQQGNGAFQRQEYNQREPQRGDYRQDRYPQRDERQQFQQRDNGYAQQRGGRQQRLPMTDEEFKRGDAGDLNDELPPWV